MEDVLGVYSRPYDPLRPQVCLDELSKQLVSETQPSIPMKPGQVKLIDTEYRRNGTASVFMMTAPLEGNRYVRVRECRRREDFGDVI